MIVKNQTGENRLPTRRRDRVSRINARSRVGAWFGRLLAAVLLCIGPVQTQSADTFPEPPEIQANGKNTNLHVLFGEATVTGATDPSGKLVSKIWTRTYGLDPGSAMIPGPTFVFSPGDLLQINLHNEMDPTKYPNLADYDNKVDPTYDTDEIIEHTGHEINIPADPNNTNLHVHGLHVDPDKDNVLLIITPETDATQYDSVLHADVKRGSWQYTYRIPPDHLPGTHWYHAHKHGSTSLHVENGMAGTLIIKDPNCEILPTLGDDHDRVLVIQEITNYGTEPKKGGAKRGNSLIDVDRDKLPRLISPDITVNGVHQPQLSLARGQLERWRFVNAGANHGAFSYLWLGKQTAIDTTKKAGTDVDSVTVTYRAVPVYLVALDGITLAQKNTITIQNPLLLGPGNRADVLVQLQDEGSYAVFKNFPDSQVVSSNSTVYFTFEDTNGNPYPSGAFPGTSNPYLLSVQNSANLSVQDTISWQGPISQEKKGPTKQGIAPLLRAKPDTTEGNVLLDIDFQTTLPQKLGDSSYGWQALQGGIGGGKYDAQILMFATVADSVAKNSPQLPADNVLARCSPTGDMASVPGYVSAIQDSDILQSRVAVFDMSGVQVEYFTSANAKQDTNIIQQFTLNGRQFSVLDYIGNPQAGSLIQKPPSLPDDISAAYNLQGATASGGSYILWENEYWTNPGYYKPMYFAGLFYSYGSVSDPASPISYDLSYKDVTGLDSVSVVNTGYRNLPGNIPGPPVARTAEEWILINNSDVGHPFHIHINPFFVTEIGQLSHENDGWVIRTVGEPSNGNPNKLPGGGLTWFINQWFDTIILPPHGYVKVRFWINIPNQISDAQVVENSNTAKKWVYHCHILRHEDRGMMMIVKTQQNTASGQ